MRRVIFTRHIKTRVGHILLQSSLDFLFIVRCRDWDLDVVDSECVDKALITNNWKAATDLINVNKEDVKTILVSELSKHLNSQEHSLQDLSSRLCNMYLIYLHIFKTKFVYLI